MSDTRQGISWSLERKCPLRSGETWFLPSSAFVQLDALPWLPGRKMGTCRERHLCHRPQSADNPRFPPQLCSSSALLSGSPRPGSMEVARATCRDCEANIDDATGRGIAGCVGWSDAFAELADLDEQLARIVERKGLEQRLRSAFRQLPPLWYGFWIRSPLTVGLSCCTSCSTRFMSAKVDPRTDAPVSCAPCARRPNGSCHCTCRSRRRGTSTWVGTRRFHVAHGTARPLMKVLAESYPTELYECAVCGHAYIPNDNRSSVPDKDDNDRLELALGPEGYLDFIRNYMRRRELSDTCIDETLDNHFNGLCRASRAYTFLRATVAKFRAPDCQPCADPESFPQSLSLPLGDDLDLELVLIPAGEFQMGLPV